MRQGVGIARVRILFVVLVVYHFTPLSAYAVVEPNEPKCESCQGGFDPDDMFGTVHFECQAVSGGEIGTFSCRVVEIRTGDHYEASCSGGNTFCMTIDVYPGGGEDRR